MSSDESTTGLAQREVHSSDRRFWLITGRRLRLYIILTYIDAHVLLHPRPPAESDYTLGIRVYDLYTSTLGVEYDIHNMYILYTDIICIIIVLSR